MKSFPPPQRVPDLSAVSDRYHFFYQQEPDGSYRLHKVVRRRLGHLFKRLRESRAKITDELIDAFIAKLRREAIGCNRW